MREYYESNENFKRYVDSYCKTQKISVEEALEHELVRQVYNYYKEEQKDDKSK